MPGSRTYFGTDGVRGVVGEGLTEDVVRRLGFAFARWTDGASVLIGRDTRASGPAIEAALAEGLAGGGSKVTLGGVLPTPAVALLAEECGAVVSASHNPPEYNGVKLFAPGGRKLTDEEELEIEALFADPETAGAPPVADDSLAERYADLVVERFGAPLDGLRIACDSANGAFSAIAPGVLERLGATVTSIGDSPDGTNINSDCGATHPEALAELVRDGDFDLGVAFDGDGDRVVAVDADGNAMDGDGILAVLAAPPGRRPRRGHDDDEPRLPQADGGATGSARSRPTWATATCSRRSTARAASWAASSRATSPGSTGTRPGTDSSRRCSSRGPWSSPGAPSPSWARRSSASRRRGATCPSKPRN